MSGVNVDDTEAWQAAFLQPQEHTTPAPDHQPGWMLTAIGISLCAAALAVLSL